MTDKPDIAAWRTPSADPITSFMLIDGVEMNRTHPSTFEIPSAEDKAAIKPGDYVKVGAQGFGEDVTAERFWVKVTMRGDDAFIGEVNNNLVFTHQHGLQFKDVVQFQARHILMTGG